MCGICGADVVEEEHLFCALYNTDNVKITRKEAMTMYREKLKILETQKKLILVLDLDQTILHTVCDAPSLRDTIHFRIDDSEYCVKLRPGLRRMLDKISKMYEIHVYTMGTREYAKKITEAIDPSKEYFHDRVITRDENQGLLVKRLDRLFPYKHRNIVILDDRPDVWEFCKNLVLVKPFWYFNRIDINDPGLLKKKLGKEMENNKGFGGIASRKVERIKDMKVISRLEDMALEASTEDETSKVMRMNEMLQDAEVDYVGSSAPKNDGDVDEETMSMSSHTEDVEDTELVRVTKFLVKIHGKYFRSRHKNIKRILDGIRRKIFGGSRFFVPESSNSAGLARMIRMYGGRVCSLDRKAEFIVSSCLDGVEDIAKRFGCLVISPKWIVGCAYSLRRINYRKYVICDYRVKDEYEEELEKFFL